MTARMGSTTDRRSGRGRTAALAGPRPAVTFVPPYPPSWLDRLIDRIGRVPGPAWWPYAASILLLVGLLGLTQRLADPGSFDPGALVFAIYPAYIVALTRYLDHQAASALEAFRPAMRVGDAEFERIRYELTTLPAAPAWIASALAIPATYLFIVAPGAMDFSAQAIPGEALALLLTAFTSTAFLVLILHTVRDRKSVV